MLFPDTGVLLRCPAAASLAKLARVLPTAATRSPPLTPPPAAVGSLPGLSPAVRVLQHKETQRPFWGAAFLGAGDRTRFAFLSEDKNYCFAPSSRREQQSPGLLHLDRFEPGSHPIKQKREAEASLFCLVPVAGLEPARCRQRWILSPLRLPFHHTGRCVFHCSLVVSHR